MSYGINRERALELVGSHIQNENLIKHCLAAEAVLRAMAAHLDQDVEKWGLAGLLHDLDAETHADLDNHTQETARILREEGVDTEIIEAIRLHNLQAHPGEERTTVFQHALAAGETITGLVIATAQNTFDANGVFGAMLVIGMLALSAEWLMAKLEKWLLAWQPKSSRDSNIQGL